MDIFNASARVETNNILLWKDSVREHFLPLDFSIRRSESFNAKFIARPLGDAQLAQVAADAHRVSRTRHLADRSDRSYFKVFWQLHGKSLIEQGRNSADLAPGFWTFYDTSRPYDIELSDSSGFAVLLIPQEKCSRLSLSASGKTGQAFRSSSASRAALAVVMTALSECEDICEQQAHAVVDAATDLILSALIDRADRLPSFGGPQFEDVCAYINTRLADEDLTPLSIAQAFSVSRRKLYSLFEKNGHSPHAFIQQARLERCRISMIDPSCRWKKITRIAFDHGFNDMAYFSRVFKAAYGLAPRDYRAIHNVSK